MATTVTRYLDPNSTAGGNGTSPALTGDNRAFVTYAEWQTAMKKNLVTADEESVLVISGNGAVKSASDYLEFTSGWVTDSTRKVIVRNDTESHGGRLDDVTTGKISTVTNGVIFNTGSSFDADFYDVVITTTAQSGTNSWALRSTSSSGGTINFHRCVVSASRRGTSNALDTGGSGVFYNFMNCLLRASSLMIYANQGAAVIKLYNCVTVGGGGTLGSVTFYNSFMGYQSSAVPPVTINCINGGGDVSQSGIFYADPTTVFTNYGDQSTAIFTLKLTSPAIGAGVDTRGYSAPANFTNDILNVTRTLPWDIGIHEKPPVPLYKPFPSFRPAIV